ncbi:MAG: nucleotide sugar dehydrogenase [Dehalococcoidales bacterium]
MENVCVIGLWHLGCVYSAGLADLGYRVIGVDSDIEVVKNLNRGIPPIYEPNLKEQVIGNIKSGALCYTADIANTVSGCPYIMITADTPLDDNDEVDLSPIREICKSIAPYLQSETLLIICSQVPVGTCDVLKTIIEAENPAARFDIVYSPENLKLGNAIAYFKQPDRIIIGADSENALTKAEKFFSVTNAPIIKMGLRSAEAAKHALNAFLATSISFCNEIANICDEVGADALDVMQVLHSDSRIGNGIPLLPGLGFSGGTLARDLKVIQKIGKENNCDTLLTDSVLAINRKQNSIVISKLERKFNSLVNLNISVLGLTYKPHTDTLRRSAALTIIAELIEKGAKVKAYDPCADISVLKKPLAFEFCDNAYSAANNSDALAFITEWPEFKALDFCEIKKIMKTPILIDVKNMLNMKEMELLGFSYIGIGRGK